VAPQSVRLAARNSSRCTQPPLALQPGVRGAAWRRYGGNLSITNDALTIVCL